MTNNPLLDKYFELYPEKKERDEKFKDYFDRQAKAINRAWGYND